MVHEFEVPVPDYPDTGAVTDAVGDAFIEIEVMIGWGVQRAAPKPIA
jgi:hypothetical protein